MVQVREESMEQGETAEKREEINRRRTGNREIKATNIPALWVQPRETATAQIHYKLPCFYSQLCSSHSFPLCIFKFNFLAFRKSRKKRTHGTRVLTMYADRHRQVPVWFMNSKPQFRGSLHPGTSPEVGMVM